MMRLFINAIWERTIANGKSFVASNSDEKFKLAKTLVGFFYFLVLWLSIQSFGHFSQNPEWDVILSSQDLFVPIWPTMWMSYVDWEFANRAILLYFLCSAVLACVFWKRYRLVRILLALGLFMYVAQVSSFGKIDHYNHLMVLASFLFIFLPNIRKGEKSDGVSFLQVFFGNQALLLLTYFTSGYYKFKGIYEQEHWGMLSALSPESLAHNIAKTSIARGESYFFSDYVFENPGYHFSALLIAGYFVEFLSVYIIFKPQLHRLWGLLLILLHGMILMTVGPDFSIQLFVLGLFLLFSPFYLGENGIVDGFRAILKSVKSTFKGKSKHSSILVYYNSDSRLQQACVAMVNSSSTAIVLKRQSSPSFLDFMKQYPDLQALKSIVVISKSSGGTEEVAIKAKGLTVLFGALHMAYIGFKWLYIISPLFADIAYDLAEKTKQKPIERKP